jgi:hypothetical protein
MGMTTVETYSVNVNAVSTSKIRIGYIMDMTAKTTAGKSFWIAIGK